jgi:hypothetical protein
VSADPEVTVRKFAGFVPISTELAIECGLITEAEARERGWTPTVYPPIPRRTRLRWRWQSFRERAGRKLGGWIAGVDLSEREIDE